MGLIVAIGVGILCFLIVSSADNASAGIIFGAIMFAMAYGAFVWRPGERKPSAAEPIADAELPPTMGSEDMTRTSSAREQAVVNALAIPLTGIGLDDEAARASSQKIVAEVLSEFRPRGIDPFKSTQGDEYLLREDFTNPRVRVGLTSEDIRQHWNRPLLLVMGEFKMRELMNFVFVDVARLQGRDPSEVGREYKKMFPRYGDPRKFNPNEKFNQDLRPEDADIFPEFSSRVDIWRRRVGEAKVVKTIELHGTLNAAVRSLVSNHQL